MSSLERITQKSEEDIVFWIVEVRNPDGSSFVTNFLGTKSEAENYIDSTPSGFEITMRDTSQDVPIVISSND